MSAISTRQTRLPLTLAVGGALVLMTGFTFALIGEVLGAGKSGGSPGLLAVGLTLMAVGLALGAAVAIVLLARPMASVPAAGAAASRASGSAAAESAVRGPAGRPAAVPSQAVPSQAVDSADSAENWLGPLRGAGVQPVSAAVRQAAAARDAQSGGPRATRGHADRDGIGYSDEGWDLDSAGVAVPPQPYLPQPYPPQPYPEPPSYPVPPSAEIHHPVRPMHGPRAPGQRLGDTGQFPAYADTGPLPRYVADPGQEPDPAQPERQEHGSQGASGKYGSGGRNGLQRLSAQVSRVIAKTPGTSRPAGRPRPR